MSELDALRRTALHDVHVARGAKMVGFAGYAMPLQFDGILAEHRWTRESAGLFDVSHMGQAWLRTTQAPLGDLAAHEAVASALETLVPGEVAGLKRGGLRYSMLLNAEGGVVDDLMITRPVGDDRQGRLVLVVNAGRKSVDYALLRDALAGRAELEVQDERSLLALQGPQAETVLAKLTPGVADQTFMTMRPYDWRGADLLISRSGYTGEDGFEISVPATHAVELAEALLADAAVRPIGLGARDSLRLEAGLCLYGQDLDETTSPIEAGLAWAVGKRRREEGGFPGFARIARERADGPSRRRVGFRLLDRAPARAGAPVMAEGRRVGVVTSGGFAPSLGAPVAMGYVEPAFATAGQRVELVVRDAPRAAEVADMPFVPHRYKRA